MLLLLNVLYAQILMSRLFTILEANGNSCTKIFSPGKGNKYTRRALCQRNNLMDVPLLNDPDEIVELRLDENKIRNLHDNSFVRYGNVTYLTINENHLEHISPRAFLPLKKLERLEMQKNYLALVDNRFLKPLKTLKILNLGHNPKLELSNSFFKPLTSVEEINLEAINTLTIHKDAFRALYKLKRLNLNSCKIKTLPNMAKDFSMMRLEQINFGNNKWECDCKLRWLATWYKEKSQERNGIEILGNPLCQGPPRNDSSSYPGMKDVPLFSPKTLPTRFQCKPIVHEPKFPKSQKYTVRESENVTMSCEIYSDPKGETIWIHETTRIDKKPRHFKYQTTRSTNYTASLTIINIREEDAGTYMCRAINTRGTAELKMGLHVQVSQKTTVNRRLVIIIGIAGVIVVTCTLMIGGVFFYHYSKSNRPRRKPPVHNNQANYRQLQAQDHRRQNNMRYELPPGENGYATTESAKKRLLMQDGVDAQAVPLTAEVNLDSDTERTKMPSGYMTIRPARGGTLTQGGHVHADGSACPVHGSRQLFNCPVHGESRSGTPQLSTAPNSYGTLPAAGSRNFVPKSCPLHGELISTMTRRPHSPPGAADGHQGPHQGTPGGPFLRHKSMPVPENSTVQGSASATYVRASKVDDCISIPESAELPPPPNDLVRQQPTVNNPGQKTNPQDDEGYSTAV